MSGIKDIANEIAKKWDLEPEIVLLTESSIVAIFEKHIEKYRTPKSDLDLRQVQKSDKLLKFENLNFERSTIQINNAHLDVVRMRRFQHSDCVASQYSNLTSKNILQIFRKVQRQHLECEVIRFDRLGFKLGVSENISRQLGWVDSNMPDVIKEKVNDYFLHGPKTVENYLEFTSRTNIRLCHGDLHLGNIFFRGHMTYIIDPAENDIRFCLIPVWLDYASLVASLLLLGRDKLAEELRVWVKEENTDFDHQLFELWVTIKILVRMRFESQFMAYNQTITDSNLMGWRQELVDRGNERLSLWLSKVAYSRNENTPISNPTEHSLEALRIASQVIESRRVELSAKSNVYVAVSVALVAGNIAFLDQNSASFSLANIFLLSSAGLSLYSIWNSLGLVRTLSGRSRTPRIRGKLFFFGWWAKTEWNDVARKFDYMTELDLANELAVQNMALSQNMRFRYTTQSSVTRILRIAFIVFFLGASIQVLGINSSQIKSFMGGNIIVNAKPAPTVNTTPAGKLAPGAAVTPANTSTNAKKNSP